MKGIVLLMYILNPDTGVYQQGGQPLGKTFGKEVVATYYKSIAECEEYSAALIPFLLEKMDEGARTKGAKTIKDTPSYWARTGRIKFVCEERNNLPDPSESPEAKAEEERMAKAKEEVEAYVEWRLKKYQEQNPNASEEELARRIEQFKMDAMLPQ